MTKTDAEPWAIETRGLTKTFGTATVVRGVTLEVPGGTIFAFLGPNGSGKSTTVKLLTGLLAPTAGDVRVCGRVVSVEDVALRREIGVLPEDDALFPDLTIWEHLELCGGSTAWLVARPRRERFNCSDISTWNTAERRLSTKPRRACGRSARWRWRCCTTRACSFSTSHSRGSIPVRPATSKICCWHSP